MKNRIPKILAIYLPQYYENEDNNLWWGKGFTDWETVKTAEKYFEEQREPRVPLEGIYYDLSKRETMESHAALAKRYGIDGFCFYHYYFKDGKKELELPAENLLKWKDIDMPFCFNWASEPWIRSWSRISGNVWTEKYEKNGDNVNGAVLVSQDYGDIFSWKEHFEYLLPFFYDERYIKIDGKPVFIFYSPNDIKVLHDMLECWRRMAEEAGFPGLYLIGAHMDTGNMDLDAAIIYEPRNSMDCLNRQGRVEIKNGVRCYDYKAAWTEVVETLPISEYKTFFCGISGYDDTPRRGRSGECMVNCSAEIFKDGLRNLILKSMRYKNEFLFINAWNEWGEGMYLEPDETSGYAYLEMIQEAIHSIDVDQIEAEPACLKPENLKREMAVLDYNARKFKQLFQIMDKWLFIEQENTEPVFKYFFDKEKINTVAIYGMAAIGKHLLIQLQKENVNVVFGIDQYAGQFGDKFNIYRPEEEFPETDAIVITAYEADTIKKKLEEKYEGRIFLLEEIIDLLILR